MKCEISKYYVSVEEASKRSGYEKKQINKLKEVKRIGYEHTPDGRLLVNLKDVIQYKAAHPIKNVVWDEIDHRDGEAFYMLTGYDCKYFISNMYRVINTTNGQILTPQLRKDGYSYITFMKNGKEKVEYLHRLIALTQCPNVLMKDIVHHIKIHNPAINKASNLLWVWKWQHDELHRLLKENKIKEYNKMVNTIRKENKQRLYKIPHLDFQSSENIDYFMFITAEGYKAFKSGKDVPLNSIVRESAELKKETRDIY